jgi:LAO/AO transport system kinase
VPELVATLEEIGAKDGPSGAIGRRRRRARYLIARAAADIVASRVKDGAGRELDALADEVLSGRATPGQAAKRLLEG